MTKQSLEVLARHLELIADGQDIVARFEADRNASRERTLQAALVLKELAPFQEQLRAFVIEQKRLAKGM